MSETGATADQVEAAVHSYAKRYGGKLAKILSPDGTEQGWVKAHRQVLEWWLPHIVPPGYQIVPAGAVTLSEEEAATAREACELAASEADGESIGFASIAFIDSANEQTQRAVMFRALAAKLGGGA